MKEISDVRDAERFSACGISLGDDDRVRHMRRIR